MAPSFGEKRVTAGVAFRVWRSWGEFQVPDEHERPFLQVARACRATGEGALCPSTVGLHVGRLALGFIVGAI